MQTGDFEHCCIHTLNLRQQVRPEPHSIIGALTRPGISTSFGNAWLMTSIMAAPLLMSSMLAMALP